MFSALLSTTLLNGAGALATLMVGLAALITAFGGVIIGLRNTNKLSTNAEAVKEVHTLVNSQLTAMIARAEAAEAKVDELEKPHPLSDLTFRVSREEDD
jgi:hypothetical protein